MFSVALHSRRAGRCTSSLCLQYGTPKCILVLGIQSTTNLVSSLALQISESCLTSVMSTRIRFPRKQKAVPYIFDVLNDPDVTWLDTNQGLRECVDQRSKDWCNNQGTKADLDGVECKRAVLQFPCLYSLSSFRRDSNNAMVGGKIFRAIVQEWGNFVR